MIRLARHIFLILIVLLMAAGVCFGKQVYLKDGGIIDAQSAWRQSDKVYVKINRDIVADFATGEIDLRRTFPKAKTAHRKHPAPINPESSKESITPSAAAAKPGRTVQPDQAKGEPAAATAAKASLPPAPSAAPQQTATPAAAPDQSSPPDKAEQQRRSQEAAKMMAEAILSKDSEKMKKALELQKSAVPQQGAPTLVRPAIPTSFIVFILALCVLIIAAQWIMFQKAGQAGWKCLIPLYNMYILMQISGKPGWWMFLLFVPLVGMAVLLFAMLSLAKKFGRSELFGAGLLLLPMIFFPLLAFGGSEYEGYREVAA